MESHLNVTAYRAVSQYTVVPHSYENCSIPLLAKLNGFFLLFINRQNNSMGG